MKISFLTHSNILKSLKKFKSGKNKTFFKTFSLQKYQKTFVFFFLQKSKKINCHVFLDFYIWNHPFMTKI